jgi:hypothetical protein
VRGRPGLGGVDEEALAGIGSQREGLERQVEIAHDRVMDELDASRVDLDVMGGPPATELVAAGGQLPNQVRKSPVIGMPAGLGVQQGDSVVDDPVPVSRYVPFAPSGRARRGSVVVESEWSRTWTAVGA